MKAILQVLIGAVILATLPICAADKANKTDLIAEFKETRLSADLGNVEAQFKLATMYARGIGTPKDPPRAILWFKVAAESSHATAQYSLGYIYETGEMAQKDLIEAMIWYQKSVENGNEQAKQRINDCWSEIKATRVRSGGGVLDVSRTEASRRELNDKKDYLYVGVGLRHITLVKYRAGVGKEADNNSDSFRVRRESESALLYALDKFLEWDDLAKRTNAFPFSKPIGGSEDGTCLFEFNYRPSSAYIVCNFKEGFVNDLMILYRDDVLVFKKLLKDVPKLKVELEASIRKRREQDKLFK